MFTRFLTRRKPPQVDSGESLARFLDERASYVAQKCLNGYVHVKTNLPLHEMTREAPFAAAYEVARWEGHAAALADLVVVAEGRLRAAAARPAALVEPLVALFAAILSRHPARTRSPDDLEADAAVLRRRLHDAQEAPPRPIAEIATIGAERIYAHLPIHERLRDADKPAIVAGVQFQMVGLAHEIDRLFDAPAVAADLLAQAEPTG